ncbi:MAG: beta-lactamase family protein, partial [Gemmatimonadaceae bacterium]|nr:beta-lactamase family protein [Gemmatimonadaceae bacterium]
MQTRACLTLLAALAPALPLLAQSSSPSYARVDSAVVDELRRTSTPGAAVALVVGDSVVYAKGFGSTAADGGAAVTPATTFRIASITKVFTAATLVSLAEAGRVDLAAPIGARLGELPDSLRRITAHQLLSQTAGLIMMPAPATGADPATALADAAARVPARAA